MSLDFMIRACYMKWDMFLLCFNIGPGNSWEVGWLTPNCTSVKQVFQLELSFPDSPCLGFMLHFNAVLKYVWQNSSFVMLYCLSKVSIHLNLLHAWSPIIASLSSSLKVSVKNALCVLDRIPDQIWISNLIGSNFFIFMLGLCGSMKQY